MNPSINKSSEGTPLFNILSISEQFKSLGLDEVAFKLDSCGIREATIECDCGLKLVHLDCKIRICPNCSHKRSNRLFRQYICILKQYPIARSIFARGLRFVTFTVKNTDTLDEGLDKLYGSLKQLRRHKYFKDHIFGGMGVLEITRSLDDKWHVHMHTIIFSSYLDMKSHKKTGKDSKFVQEWKKVTGGDCVIDVRRISSHKGVLNYILKYLSKGFKNLIIEDLVIIYKGTYKRRLFFTFGKKGLFYAVIKKVKAICNVCHKFYRFNIHGCARDLEPIVEEIYKPPLKHNLESYGFEPVYRDFTGRIID